MIGPPPMCVDCKRFNKETFSCEAYPDAIPDEITLNVWDHRTPKPGDHGLQFVAKPGSPDDREWWPNGDDSQ